LTQEEKQWYQKELAKYLLNEKNELEKKLAALQAFILEDTKHCYFFERKVALFRVC